MIAALPKTYTDDVEIKDSFYVIEPYFKLGMKDIYVEDYELMKIVPKFKVNDE